MIQNGLEIMEGELFEAYGGLMKWLRKAVKTSVTLFGDQAEFRTDYIPSDSYTL
jgi:hypothetical protein